MIGRSTVVIVGLGVTGRAIARSLLHRGDVEVVGACDLTPGVVGADLGEVLGVERAGVPVVGDLESLPRADLAVVATSSDLNHVAQSLIPLLERSYNVMSLCEELAYPWSSHPALAQRLHETALANGVSVLGTGANPGMLMDTLPMLITALVQGVESVTVRRRTSMARYGAILQKFGLGLDADEFAVARDRGKVIGHHGFEQAIGALGAGLGWQLDTVEVDPVTPAVISNSTRVGDHVTIHPGEICAVTHAARGMCGGKPVIDLEIMFGFFDTDDAVSVGDDYRIVGTDQVLELSATTGFESMLSTVAVAVNSAVAVVEADPGLVSMGDLPVRALAAKGSRRAGTTP